MSMPPELSFRPAALGDWPVVAPIVAHTWEGGDYINEAVWHQWVTAPEGRLVVAVQEGRVVGFCRLTRLGPAEWWLEGIRVDPALRGQGIGRALTAHMLEIFNREGDGILRLTTGSQNEASQKIAREFGFRHTVSYTKVEADAHPADYRNFKLLQPHNLEMAFRYLRFSPIYRVSHFVEHDWVLYFLTQERLASYLADPQVQVIGWRQFDQLHGMAILFLEPSKKRDDSESELQVGYLDAPDDTTLLAMLEALRGLAALRGHSKVVWKMPVGVGLDRTLAQTGWRRVWEEGDELWLFELPLRR